MQKLLLIYLFSKGFTYIYFYKLNHKIIPFYFTYKYGILRYRFYDDLKKIERIDMAWYNYGMVILIDAYNFSLKW